MGVDFETSGVRALRRVQRGYAVVVSALYMLDMDGLDLLRRIKQVDANIEVIIMGSNRSEDIISNVMRQGAMAYLQKPFENKAVVHRTIRRAMDRWRDTRNDERLYRDMVSGLVGAVDIGEASIHVPFQKVGFPLIDLLSMMNDGFVFLDDENRITFSNVKFSRKINWPYRTVFQKLFIKFVLREDRAEFEAFINQIRVERRTGIHETRMVNRIGQVIQIMVACRLIEIETGHDVVLLVITDVTEQREAQERARQLATLVDRARFEAILVFDQSSNIIHCNKAAEEMFGYPGGKLLGTKLTSLFNMDLSGEAILKSEPGDAAFEMNAVDIAGNTFPVEISESEDDEGTGKRIGMIFARDIRKRKQAEADLLMANHQLKKMYEDLLAAQSTQRRFFANMSHELKTPLNTIGGYASLMRDGVGGALSEKHLRWVESIKTQSGQLLKMIQEILEYAKLDKNGTTVRFEPIDPVALVKDLKSTAVALLAHKQVSVETDIQSERAEIVTDGDRLRQVMMNLLGNAAKFTDQGEIRIVLRDESETHISFTVSDTGCGIPEDELGRIFDDFYQVAGAASQRSGSAGLGLSIVKRLVENLGGEISVESIAREGSKFTVVLPIK